MTAPGTALSTRGARILRGAAGIVVFLGVAEAAARAGLLDDAVPPVSEILAQAVALLGDPQFTEGIADTMLRWAYGLALTVAAVVPAGIVLGSLPAVERLLRPIIEFLRPIPSIALIPLAILFFQDALLAEIGIIVYASTWPILINTIYAVREVDPLAKETMRSFGFGPGAVLWRVALPSAAPFILTGIRISASIALIVAISTELFVPGAEGLGTFLISAQSGTDAVILVVATAVWAGFLGLAINAAFAAAGRRLFRWHHARGGEAA